MKVADWGIPPDVPPIHEGFNLSLDKTEIITIDLETTSRHKGALFGATPYDTKNHVVLYGMKCYGSDAIVSPSPTAMFANMSFGDDYILIVGANLSFDLTWLQHRGFGTYWDKGDKDRWNKKVIIWDVLLAHYMMVGHSVRYPSLDDVAEFYGFTGKNDTLKRAIEAGIDIASIPIAELSAYLEQDLKLTEQIFAAQATLLKHPLYQMKMEDLLFTIACECNGMAFDTDKANSIVESLLPISVNLSSEMVEQAELLFGVPNFNPASSQQIAAILYGGELTISRRETKFAPDGVTPLVWKTGPKAGTVRTKEVLSEMVLKPALPAPLVAKYSMEDSPRTTAEDRLKDIVGELASSSDSMHKMIKEWLDKLLTLRSITKDVSVYYEGYAKCAALDGFLHPNFNHAGTVTSRLSSSNPNLQNATHDN